jgi:hypothetical protein
VDDGERKKMGAILSKIFEKHVERASIFQTKCELE